MLIQLDFRSGLPIYEQIVQQIRQMVEQGTLKPGDQLPTVRQLATDLRVNFNTIARAYRLLDVAGLISTQQGRGTYIWEPPDESTSRMLRQQGLEELTQQYMNEAHKMNYSPEEILNAVNQQLIYRKTDISLPKK
jgi:GntR family transcriptional regulator